MILPSVTEGFPNIIIEALSVNLPIIATDCEAGPREILCNNLSLKKTIIYPFLGKYGILTKPHSINDETKMTSPLSNSEKSLADAMKMILKNPTLIEKYSNGIERAKNYDIDKIIRVWKDLFNNLNF